MPKDPSARYYNKNKERRQKRCSQRRKKKKIDSMVANDVKTFLKNKLWRSIEKLL